MRRRITTNRALVALCAAAVLSAQSTAPTHAAPSDAAKATSSSTPTKGATASNQTSPENVAQSGEARRNENIKVDIVDTNALRELNLRVGATATIVEEFKANLNYFAAEYGQSPKPPIHAVADRMSGFHGLLEWRHSNSIFAARSFFQVGAVQPARQNTFRQSVAFRVWTGAYFSATGGEDRNRGAVNGNILIPLPTERTPLATDPAVSAIIQRLLDAYPKAMPNRTDIAARAYNTNSPQSSNVDNYGGHFDQSLGAKDKFLLRYSYATQHIDAFQFVKGQNSNTDAKSNSARITWNRSWEKGALDASIGFDRQHTALTADKETIFPIATGGTFTSLGPVSNVPLNRVQNSLHGSYGIAGVTARHSWMAGFRGTRLQYNGSEANNAYPGFTFSSGFGHTAVENFLLGNASNVRFAVGSTYRAFRDWEAALYAGERWTATKNFSMAFTLRYEPWMKPTDITGKSAVPFGSDLNNISGSVGFAYRLPGEWGVVRASSGVYYGQIFPVTYGQIRWNPPNYTAFVIASPSLAQYQAYMALTPDATTRSSLITLSSDLATPYSIQSNASWEKEIKRGWRLQAGYVSSRSHKLFLVYVKNRGQYVEGIPFTSDTLNLRRANQSIYDNWTINNVSKSWYDAGRVSITAPQWRQLSLTASYWLSKALDLGGDYSLTGAGVDSKGTVSQTEVESQHDMRGRSTFDQPHSFTAQVAYRIPGPRWAGKAKRLLADWTVSSVVLLKSGTPFNLAAGSDAPGFGNNDGTAVDRPMLLDPTVLGRTIGHPDTSRSLLPKSAFRFINAPTEMSGNLGRNVFRKGGIANTNASLSRSWRTGQWRMTIAAESINLLNTPQFAAPDANLTSPSFGLITNTLNDGRAFRFNIRLEN